MCCGVLDLLQLNDDGSAKAAGPTPSNQCDTLSSSTARGWLGGEKIQWYLASELRDRIRDSKARVTVIDKLARKQYEVEPRQFEGRLLHQLPPIRTVFGDAYAELYLAEPSEAARVALTRVGTRVIEDLATLPGLEHSPWMSRYVQGLVDVPFLNLTPGARSGIIQDDRY